jgi:hypothetical protein
MLNFDFWDAEWPLIVAAPHIVLGGLAVAILILVVFLIVQLACSRQIAGQKAESVALNRRLRLASDRHDEVTRKLETVTTKVVELAQHIMGKATISVLLDDTAKLSGTIVDLAHANTELATTLTTSRTTAQSTQYTTTWLLSVDSRFGAGRTVARIIGRIFLTLALLAVSGFVLLVLIGLWDRYERETAASGLTGIYVGDLASQADLSYDPKDRAAAEAERARQGGVGREQLAPAQFFQQVPKLVGTGAAGSTNQGMSVALSADGNTTIVGGPGPNNADRDRSPLLGPAGAAWVFTRSGGVWTQQGDKLVAAGAQDDVPLTTVWRWSVNRVSQEHIIARAHRAWGFW